MTASTGASLGMEESPSRSPARLVSAAKRVLPQGIPLADDIWVKRHRALLTILWLHSVALTAYALAQGYGITHSLFEGSLMAVAAVVGSQKELSRIVRMGAVTAGLVTSSAVMVHLTGGLIEAHFHFFVVVAMITLYQAWIPFLLAIGYVVLHHGIMGAIDPSSVFNHPAALAHPWRWAAVHGAFIAGASAAGLAAWRLNEDAQNSLTRSFERQLDREQHHLRQQADAQRALKQSEERFRSLVQNSYDIVTVVNENGNVEYISPSVQRVLGYDPATMIGRSAGEWAHEDDMALAGEKTALVMENPDAVADFVMRARHADGSWKWLEITLHNQLSNPAIKGIVAHQRDITDRTNADEARQRLEEQLRQGQKLEAVGQLAGGVAHDFNNLLSVIQNFARFVYDDMDPADPRREDLSEILGAGDRAANLVRQLLTFSRKDLIRPQIWDLNGIVAEMTKLLSRTIPENVELDLQVGKGPIYVNVDRGQIEQVIMNVAVNARDAMTSGGCLTVKTGTRVIESIGGAKETGMLAPGAYAHLAMADSGVGMDEATLNRAFEPFFTTKSRDSGTGLGLATVYGIVEHAGGHVSVESEQGVGTTLHVYLPLSPSGAEEEVVSPKAPIDLRGRETVLVAEDEKGVRSVVERVLRGKGYNVISAGSGEEALALAGEMKGRIDLLLTDLVMPHMSGTELAAQLPDVDVVYMSGYSDDVLSKQGVPSEGTYLQKPFSPEALLNKVRDVLDSRRRETTGV